MNPVVASDDLFFTQRLVDNVWATRRSAFECLKKHLNEKSQDPGFLYEDFVKIWKGLFYCMYNADKPLFQEELAENTSHLVYNLTTNAQKHLFLKVAFETFAREWNGIDKFRMDKYCMLFARVLRQYLYYLHSIKWCIEEVFNMSQILESSIICPFDQTNKISMGLKIYLSTIILQELSKVGKETVPDKALITILCPFFKVLAASNQPIYIKCIQENIMEFLIKHSKLGILHQEDVGMNELELADVPENMDGDEDACGDENELDPRAGGSDVYLPLLNPNFKMIADALKAMATIPELRSKNKHLLDHRITQFLTMDKGKYPYDDPLRNLNMKKQVKMKNLKKRAVKRRITLDCKSDCNLGDDEEEEEETPVAKRKRQSRFKCKKPKIPKLEVKKQRKAELEMRSKLKEKMSNPEFFLISGSVKDDLPLPTEASKVLESTIRSSGKVLNSNLSQLNRENVKKIKSKTTHMTQKVVAKKKVGKKTLKKKKCVDLHNCLPAKKKALLSGSKTTNASVKSTSSTLSDCKDVFSISSQNLCDIHRKKNSKTKLSQTVGIKKKNSNKKLKVKSFEAPPQHMTIVNKTGMKTNEKMLKINLGKNKEHAFKDYRKVIRSSPGIPYSASKMPLSPALKPSIQKFGKKSPNPKFGKKSLDAKIRYLRSKYNV